MSKIDIINPSTEAVVAGDDHRLTITPNAVRDFCQEQKIIINCLKNEINDLKEIIYDQKFKIENQNYLINELKYDIKTNNKNKIFNINNHTSPIIAGGKPYISNKTFTTKSGEVQSVKCIKVYAFNLVDKNMVVFDTVTFASYGLCVKKNEIFTYNCINRKDGTFWVCYKINNPEDEEKLLNLLNDPKIGIYKYMFDNMDAKAKLKYGDIIKELQIDKFLLSRRY